MNNTFPIDESVARVAESVPPSAELRNSLDGPGHVRHRAWAAVQGASQVAAGDGWGAGPGPERAGEGGTRTAGESLLSPESEPRREVAPLDGWGGRAARLRPGAMEEGLRARGSHWWWFVLGCWRDSEGATAVRVVVWVV